MTLLDPDIARQAKEFPPDWFWEYYDAHLMKKSVHPAACIRDVPLYVRWRWRVIDDILRSVALERGRRSKAMAVFDVNV